MKIKFAALTSVARQVEGEFVFVNILKVSTRPDHLEKVIANGTLPRVENIGGVPCVLEYGIMRDLELEVSNEELGIAN